MGNYFFSIPPTLAPTPQEQEQEPEQNGDRFEIHIQNPYDDRPLVWIMNISPDDGFTVGEFIAKEIAPMFPPVPLVLYLGMTPIPLTQRMRDMWWDETITLRTVPWIATPCASAAACGYMEMMKDVENKLRLLHPGCTINIVFTDPEQTMPKFQVFISSSASTKLGTSAVYDTSRSCRVSYDIFIDPVVETIAA
jgi:hypothetical protein